MISAKNQHRGGSAAKRFAILPYFNLVLAAALTLGLVGVTQRMIDSEHDKIELELELNRTRTDVERMRRHHDDKISVLVRSTEAERDTQLATYSDYTEKIGEMENRLSDIESGTRLSSDRAVATFREELEEMRATFDSKIRTETPDIHEVFRNFERDHSNGVLLVYTEFEYDRIRKGEKSRTKTVSGWGSGFFVSEDGHLVTNKHVIQPWKFDPDLAAMTALGEARVNEDSLKICVWQVGSKAVDETGEPIFKTGFSNTAGTLEIVAHAPDSMSRRDMDLGAFAPDYELHDLDDNDVVVLKAKAPNGEKFPALPLATGAKLDKLDPIMALGFPRGQNGLEEGRVETSPSLGTVRKVEKTIHVTASIIPGNSGGPLIGPDGRVVGIVTRVYSETLGICLKLDRALSLIESESQEETASIGSIMDELRASKNDD